MTPHSHVAQVRRHRSAAGAVDMVRGDQHERKREEESENKRQTHEEECGGDEVETLIRKASTMDRRTSMDLAMKKDGNGHSHSEWELQHTGENFGHDDETAALEAKLARKHIRVATLTDLSKFANKIKQSLSVHHGRRKSGSS